MVGDLIRKETQMERRKFLKTGLAAFGAPLLFGGCCTFHGNSKINVAIIGCGRISTEFEVPGVLARPDIARIVAVCDLDMKRARLTADHIEKTYCDGTKVRIYKDYKEVCAQSDVDAVMICLPDFWHALVATTAICSRKAVWLQKPFAQMIEEGRLLADLAKRYRTVFQVGSQQRSWSQFQAAVKAVRSGVLGEIKRVEVGLGLDPEGGSSTPQKVPSTFDYQTWLGPTDPSAPYCESRCHSQSNQRARPGWIELMPYGWGMITNWGAHHLDIARWGLGAVGPDSVSGTCTWLDTDGGKLWNVHKNYDLHFSINGGKSEIHASDRYQNGVKFVGERDDWIFCTRGAFKVTPSDPDPVVKPGELGPLEASRKELLPKMWSMKKSCLQAHVDDWLEAIAANDPSLTATNAEEGHRSTALSSLGMMCMELGRGRKDGFTLSWDAQRETTGKAEYDALMKPFSNGKFDLKVNLAEFGLESLYDKI